MVRDREGGGLPGALGTQRIDYWLLIAPRLIHKGFRVYRQTLRVPGSVSRILDHKTRTNRLLLGSD